MQVHDHACCPAPGVRHDGTRNPCVGYCFGGGGGLSCHATAPNFPCCFACKADRKEVCPCPCHMGKMLRSVDQFSVGDRVRVIGSQSQFDGMEGVIHKVSDDGTYGLLFSDCFVSRWFIAVELVRIEGKS